MSSSFIKLIDSSIIPACSLILGKVLGLYLVIAFFGLEWQMEFVNNSIITVYPVVFEKDLIIVSSYSDLIMLSIFLFGYVYLIIRALFFHNTHIDPRLVVRLANLNLLGLIKDSFKVYHTFFVWTAYLIIAVLYVLNNAINGATHWWIFALGLVGLVVGVTLIVRDFEGEINRSKSNLSF